MGPFATLVSGGLGLASELFLKKKIDEYSSDGYRVLALARQDNIKKIPSDLSKAKLSFEGLIALYDPPRYGIKESLKECYSAGIRVIMITGDNGDTGRGIAKKIGLENYDNIITGEELEMRSPARGAGLFGAKK